MGSERQAAPWADVRRTIRAADVAAGKRKRVDFAGMPPASEILMAQADLVHRLDINCEDAHRTCWACRWTGDAADLARAHIDARRNGGSYEPENFFLLCGMCHEDQPDGAPVDVQLAWLLNHDDHITVTWKGWRGPIDAMFAEARRLGDEGLPKKWQEEIGGDRFRELYNAKMDAARGFGTQLNLDRARWAMVGEFKAWAAGRAAKAEEARDG